MSEGVLGAQLANALLPRLFPLDDGPAPVRGDEAIEWLARAERIDRWGGFLIAAAILPAAAAMTWLLGGLARLAHGREATALVDLRLHLIYFALPGVFLGILVVVAGFQLVIRLRLGLEDFRIYQWASSANSGYDMRRANRRLGRPLLAILCLAILLMIDCRLRVTPAGIEINRLSTLGTRTIAAADVREVYVVVRQTGGEGLIFDLADGTRYDAGLFDSFPDFDAGRVVAAIETHWRRPVKRVDADRLPPTN